ncbi:MAG: KamA family radical SAM protein [Bacteroides sp.]|nr:KamA family radical SAM protein [Bacteroides sp.]
MKASELNRGPLLESKEASMANETDEPPSGLSISKPVLNTSPGRTVISDRSLRFLRHFFPGTSLKDWSSWQWQVRNSFTSLTALSRIMNLGENEIKPRPGVNDSLPLRITPYYASLLDCSDPDQAIRRTVVPVFDEFLVSPGEASDPLSEGHDSPVPNLVHRYPDRVLFLSTGFCSAYCRYCTRSHMVASEKCHVGPAAWQQAFQYIREHPEIRDVLISGGDVLTLPDGHIEYLLASIRAIPHVEIIRLGTKVPVVLPQRITKALTSILRKYHPIFMSIHFTHPDELTPEVSQACNRLADAGIPLGSQTVLLKGINDEVITMRKLMQGLLKIRVRPYYLYQCDPILGSAHFRTSVEKGLEIIDGLRGHTSGYAVPHYVIDAPGGGGKIPLLPDYFQGKENGQVILRNYEGKRFFYPNIL